MQILYEEDKKPIVRLIKISDVLNVNEYEVVHVTALIKQLSEKHTTFRPKLLNYNPRQNIKNTYQFPFSYSKRK
jgi:hypothetical protein